MILVVEIESSLIRYKLDVTSVHRLDALPAHRDDRTGFEHTIVRTNQKPDRVAIKTSRRRRYTPSTIATIIIYI